MMHSAESVRRFQLVYSQWETGSGKKTFYRVTPLNLEQPTSQNSIADLPLVTYQERDRDPLWFEGRPTADPKKRRRRDHQGGHRDCQGDRAWRRVR